MPLLLALDTKNCTVLMFHFDDDFLVAVVLGFDSNDFAFLVLQLCEDFLVLVFGR